MMLRAYRRLEVDPYLVPALINLATSTGADEIAGRRRSERAIAIDPGVRAHFNLGNIFHDLGRYPSSRVLSACRG
jgi:hypothetical protein